MKLEGTEAGLGQRRRSGLAAAECSPGVHRGQARLSQTRARLENSHLLPLEYAQYPNEVDAVVEGRTVATCPSDGAGIRTQDTWN